MRNPNDDQQPESETTRRPPGDREGRKGNVDQEMPSDSGTESDREEQDDPREQRDPRNLEH